MYRLHTSYYSKFTGFLPQDMAGDEDEISYPSQVVYDFDRIAKLNEALDITDVEYTEDPEPKKPTGLKALLQAKLEEKKANQAEQKKKIDNTDGK